MTITNAGLTAALAPVREELDKLESETDAEVERGEICYEQGWGRDDAISCIRSTLDRVHPSPDVLAALGMVALGMVRELKESEQIGICAQRIEGGPQAYENWHKRADELLAAAYPQLTRSK